LRRLLRLAGIRWRYSNPPPQDSTLLCFSFWLYSPIQAFGRLHETFRFTSVTRSSTVGRTPWTGDQLAARPLPVHKHRKTHTQHKH
jgi:hypothetical protein